MDALLPSSVLSSEQERINDHQVLLEQNEALINQIAEKVRQTQPPMSNKLQTLTRCEKYQHEHMKNKIHAIAKQFPYMYCAQGDGNCFYRAYIFTLMMRARHDMKFKAHLLAVFEPSLEKLESEGVSRMVLEDAYELLINGINESEDVMKTDESMYIVMYVRIMIAKHMLRNREMYEMYVENQTLEEFVAREVEPMDRESDHIVIMATVNEMQIPIDVTYLDNAPGIALVHRFAPHEVTDIAPVTLLYTPGHYDVLSID